VRGAFYFWSGGGCRGGGGGFFVFFDWCGVCGRLWVLGGGGWGVDKLLTGRCDLWHGTVFIFCGGGSGPATQKNVGRVGEVLWGGGQVLDRLVLADLVVFFSGFPGGVGGWVLGGGISGVCVFSRGVFW